MTQTNSSTTILILGSGMVGRLIAVELSKSYPVTVADRSALNLSFLKKYPNIQTIEKDLSPENMQPADFARYDLVIGALPGSIGFKAARNVLSFGKHYIDISFFPEDVFELEQLAKEQDVIFIPDAGVAPGLSNLVAGYFYHHHEMHTFKCMVGGLPIVRKKPFEYKAPFSPSDVIEEYTRPARIRRNDEIITLPPLTEIEPIDVKQIGTLEAFLSDGLRSLLKTIPISNLEEKTLRYPGHAQLMKAFADAGFFKKEKLNINDTEVSPLELTSKLLFKEWKLYPEDKEFTFMRMEMDCANNQQFSFELFDKTDESTGFSSMSRTTGFTCTAITEAFLSGKLPAQKGLLLPEHIAKDKNAYNFILNYLQEKGIEITMKNIMR